MGLALGPGNQQRRPRLVILCGAVLLAMWSRGAPYCARKVHKQGCWLACGHVHIKVLDQKPEKWRLAQHGMPHDMQSSKNLCEIYTLVYSTSNFDTMWKIHVKYTNQYTENFRFWHLVQYFINAQGHFSVFKMNLWHVCVDYQHSPQIVEIQTVAPRIVVLRWRLSDLGHLEVYI